MNDNRSLFFPMALIAAGLIWLLINFGYVPAENLWAVTRLWPFLLIGAGINLILRDRGLLPTALVQALLVLGMMGAIIFAPQLGWAGAPHWNPSFGNLGSERGSGTSASETRPIDSQVNTLVIRYPARVEFIQGDTAQVRISADDNLLPQLETRVNGDTLTIRNPHPWQQRVTPTKPVEIEVTLPALSRVELDTAGSITLSSLRGDSLVLIVDGAGSVQLQDLQLDHLEARLNGAGTVFASGTVQQLTLELDGVGSYEGEQLAAQNADVTVSGVGSAKVRASQTLHAKIEGVGSISYYGSPQVQQETDGLGSIHRAGD